MDLIYLFYFLLSALIFFGTEYAGRGRWNEEYTSLRQTKILQGIAALGIALQNFPEGAIVSMPLLAEGMPKGKTFLYGVLSGVVEPLGALLTIWAAGFFLPVMPYLLSFAAGAMIYVVVEEMIPALSESPHSNIGTLCFAAGFVLMMALDVVLG